MIKVVKKSIQENETKKLLTQKRISQMNARLEEEQAAELAKKNKLPYVDLHIFPINNDELRTISEEDSLRYHAVVFKKKGKEIYVAVDDPKRQESLNFFLSLQNEHGWKMKIYVASKASLSRGWQKYKEAPFLENIDILHMSLSGRDLEAFESEFGDLLALKKRIHEIPTTQIVNAVISGAIKMGASDIHFEPQEKQLRLRYRLDGMLQDIGYFPQDAYHFLVSRVKILGGMKINVRDLAQDGNFTVMLEKGRIDMRVSIIPGKYGENIVMRLLDQATVLLKVEDLGLRGLAYEQLLEQIEKPNGMILNTGPTGSGKTTTLYALINRLNKADTKIITIEDPIEYEIQGISQTQVSKSHGYTFTNGLRAIVRQDPDVILVGEIRDDETADIAINAALTGHLVLSTVHSNNASATIPRLFELGIKPNLIAPSINALIAQRLVRKLCPYCKEEYAPAKETIDSIKKILAIISPKAKVEIPKKIEKLYRSVGCPYCHGLGYKGRIGVFEVLTISEEIEKLVLAMSGESDIARQALEEGMITMTQDGILKALDGITSLEEVFGVTGQTDFLEEIYEKLMEQSLSRSIIVDEKDLQNVSENLSSLSVLSDFIGNLGQKNVLRHILGASLLLSAGDIHVEPAEKEFHIRFRIDGILQTVVSLPLNEYPTFLGEIKALSGLKAETRDGVKDSRFTISIERPFEKLTELKTDVRVSIILGGQGETVVMRLLNQSAVALDVDKIGIREQNLKKILHEAKKPNGFFLNTGPTGSGKTTTLYSLLKILNTPEVKIITVEDPIEYQLPGVLQTQVNDKNGYNFPTALRALLRQNPDIMMIGEIRDEETANIALQSSLTGHLVLSTLHTNDASGAISRLVNMGIRLDDLATATNGFMAQRLVRKLCDCKQKRQIKEEEKMKIENALKEISPATGVKIPSIEGIFQPRGCEKCNGIGYKGRTTVSEVLVIDREIREMIASGALSFQVKAKAMEKGMLTMLQDGILKVLEGETTLEDVLRVTEE